MREIKFRAWCNTKIDPFMTYEVDDIDFKEGRVYVMEGLVFNYPEEAILMQYTGLKDKNGTEIYEGDIVTGTFIYRIEGSIDKYSCPEPLKGVVVFDDGMYMLEVDERPARVRSFYFNDMQFRASLEVIGNIYENPELLKGDKHG